MLFRCVLATLLLCLLPMGMTAQSQAGPFEVPFRFVAFDSEFEPGQYLLSDVLNSKNIRLIDRESGRSRYIIKGTGRAVKTDGRNALVFERMGNLYVLREILYGAEGRGNELPLSKQRSDFVQIHITQGVQPERLLIAASW